jgi:nucleoside 2-deoxyribosyltransferase
MRQIVYLAGPITGCSYEGCTDWRDRFEDELNNNAVQTLSPMRGKTYLKGLGDIAHDYPGHVMSCQHGIMVRDHFDTTRATLLVVNLLGAEKVSIGTVMEMSWAWDNGIPVVCMMEEGNVHDHPMLRETIGFRVESEEEALHVVRTILWTY